MTSGVGDALAAMTVLVILLEPSAVDEPGEDELSDDETVRAGLAWQAVSGSKARVRARDRIRDIPGIRGN